jgi:NADPH-dependent 2,4-dienoyl-CoA reductase/sulfur reductase-like enzyme
VRYLRTRRDAELLVAEADAAHRAVVIGAGFIGLEAAASLRARGLEVVVVSPDRVPLARLFGPDIAAHIRSIHEAHGVGFRLGRNVVSLSDSAVRLDDGSTIDADLIVAGIGVTPDLELARAAGINVDDGILVDEYLQTSAGNVYACGDAAAWPDAGGAPMRVEHWVIAGRQGQTAARNILGRRERFTAVPFFWSAHFDITIGLIGNARSWDDIEIDGSLAGNDATIVYRKAGDIVAVATIGRDRVSLAAEAAMERGDRAALEELSGRPAVTSPS